MSYTLPPLPYALDALAPVISAETLDYHYNKHHAGYVTKLNALVLNNASLKDVSLDALLLKDRSTLPAGVYNCAAQTWNHTFYWKSLTAPKPAGTANLPSEKLNGLIVKSFGSFDAFKKSFSDVAAGHFGSGWAWLVQDKATGLLKIVETHDAVSAFSGTFFLYYFRYSVYLTNNYFSFSFSKPLPISYFSLPLRLIRNSCFNLRCLGTRLLYRLPQRSS